MRSRMHRPVKATAAAGNGAPAGPRRAGRSGFSLIELMAAVCILMIIVGLLTIVFRESDRAWYIGTGRASNAVEGRAAINMISHDLQYAVADDVLTFALRQDVNKLNTYGYDNDEICFVSIQHNSSGTAPRAAREMMYYLKEMLPEAPGRYQLQRAYYSKEISDTPKSHSYFKKDWYKVRPSNSQVIAENVVGLSFYWPGSTTNHEYYSITPANSNQLPRYVDVYLEVLNERDAKRVVEMSDKGISPNEYIERNVRRYTTRVHFYDRNGYRRR